MKFRINYNGDYQDSIIIEGEDINEVILIANQETDKRNWEKENCWSEQMK